MYMHKVHVCCHFMCVHTYSYLMCVHTYSFTVVHVHVYSYTHSQPFTLTHCTYYMHVQCKYCAYVQSYTHYIPEVSFFVVESYQSRDQSSLPLQLWFQLWLQLWLPADQWEGNSILHSVEREGKPFHCAVHVHVYRYISVSSPCTPSPSSTIYVWRKNKKGEELRV